MKRSSEPAPRWARPIGLRSKVTALPRRPTLALASLLPVLAVATVVVWVTEDRQAVRVVEVGFSPVQEIDGAPDGISWAAIVENTSDETAYRVDLRLRFETANGEVDDSSRKSIDVLLPGESVGIGGDTVQGMGDRAEPMTSIDVEVDEVVAVEPPGDHVEAHAEDLWVGYSPSDELVVPFNPVPSPYQPNISAFVNVVFRDDRGEIVGGVQSGTALPNEPDEQVNSSVALSYLLPGAATAEVYVFPNDRT